MRQCWEKRRSTHSRAKNSIIDLDLQFDPLACENRIGKSRLRLHFDISQKCIVMIRIVVSDRKLPGLGLFGNLAVGVIGSLLGGFLFGLVGLSAHGLLGALITATAGAVVLLFIVRQLR